MTKSDDFETIELGSGTVDVRFLRGVCNGKPGWWIIRTGKDFDYHDAGFFEPRRDGKPDLKWTPGMSAAADAVHLTFCDETGEGLTVPKVSKDTCTLRDFFGRRDGILYRVTVRRTLTQRKNRGAVH